MKRRKRPAVGERRSVGERWAAGTAYGELFATFKRLSPDAFDAAVAKFVQQSQLVPTTVVATVPEHSRPKRFESVPEIAALRGEPDGEGFVRILGDAWHLLENAHPLQWTADQVIEIAAVLQRDAPGSALRLLEGMRRFWAQLPGSPYHALEQERVVRFLNLLGEQEQWE